MTTFTTEQSIPSTLVTRDLVNSLEDYIAAKVTALAQPSDEQDALKQALRITVVDGLGQERFGSIKEFAPTKFPDSTSEISVEFRGAYKALSALTIDIQFAESRRSSRLRVSFDGPNAREVVLGITAGIMACINAHPARNGWAHPPIGVSGLLAGLAPFLLFMSVQLWFKMSPLTSWALTIVAVPLICYAWFGERLRPFTVFDSARSERRERAWDWFIKGFASFLVFGTLFVLLKERIWATLSGVN